MNISTTGNKTGNVIKILLTKKSLGTDGFTTELYRNFREDLTSILLKFFNKLKEKDYFQIYF